MSKLIRIILFLLSAVLTMLLLVLAAYIWRPHWVINTTTVSYAIKQVNAHTSLKIGYKSLELEVSSVSWNRKQVDFLIGRPCVRYADTFASCFEQFHTTLVLDILGKPSYIPLFGPSKLINGDIRLSSSDETEIKEDEFEIFSVRNYIRGVEFHNLLIRNIKLVMASSGKPDSRYTLERFELSGQNDQVTAVVAVRGHNREGFKRVSARVNLKQQTIDAVGEVNSAAGGLNLRVSARGNVTPTSALLRVTSVFDRPINAINHLGIKDCRLYAKYTDNLYEIGLSECLVELSRRLFKKERDFPIGLPKEFAADLVASINLDWGQTLRIRPSSAELKLRSVNSELFTISGLLSSTVQGSVSEARSNFAVQADLGVVIDKFEHVVKGLEGSDLSIPAPLNTLQGRLRCDLRGQLAYSTGSISMPHQCASDLKGGEQALVLREHGTLALEFLDEGIAPALDADIELQDVKLYLPDIGLRDRVPGLKPDPRFIDKKLDQKVIDAYKKKIETQGNLTAINLKIKTTKNPIAIVAPGLNTTFRIQTDLEIKRGEPEEGYIFVEPFKVKIVKKKTEVQQLRIDFAKELPAQIKARAVMERTEFDVIVDVFGDLARPSYRISSNPDRPESELVSSIMYGSSFDSLGNDGQRSVAETQAAVADGAIGLVSMFYLAATPIESVGYNAHTGEFHATVKLVKGTALTVGSSIEGERSIGLTRRLFGNWSFETYSVPGEADGSGRVVALLRWARRY